jgi:integral membrane protein
VTSASTRPAPAVEDLRPALRRYQVLAWVVGVLLIVLTIGVVLKYLTTDGSSAQTLGESVTHWVGIAHGWLYMAFLVLAALLARAARWSLPFTVMVLLSGLVPFGTLYAERRATARTLQAPS